jgi:hypothetical protein
MDPKRHNVGRCGLDYSGLWYRPQAGCCTHSNGVLGSKKDVKSLTRRSKSTLLHAVGCFIRYSKTSISAADHLQAN